VWPDSAAVSVGIDPRYSQPNTVDQQGTQHPTHLFRLYRYNEIDGGSRNPLSAQERTPLA
jgi:hypothetical protein